MNRKFSQRMPAELGNCIGLQQHVTGNRRYINGADIISARAASHLAPVELDDDLAGIGCSRSAIGALPLIEVIVVSVGGERDRVGGEIRAGKARIKRNSCCHPAYPAVYISIVAVRDDGDAGREAMGLDSQEESQGKNT